MLDSISFFSYLWDIHKGLLFPPSLTFVQVPDNLHKLTCLWMVDFRQTKLAGVSPECCLEPSHTALLWQWANSTPRFMSSQTRTRISFHDCRENLPLGPSSATEAAPVWPLWKYSLYLPKGSSAHSKINYKCKICLPFPALPFASLSFFFKLKDHILSEKTAKKQFWYRQG